MRSDLGRASCLRKAGDISCSRVSLRAKRGKHIMLLGCFVMRGLAPSRLYDIRTASSLALRFRLSLINRSRALADLAGVAQEARRASHSSVSKSTATAARRS